MPKGRKPVGEGRLTPRERDVLDLLTESETSQEIANELEISKRTVDFHLMNIYEKLEVGSGHRAIVVAHRRGLIDLRSE